MVLMNIIISATILFSSLITITNDKAEIRSILEERDQEIKELIGPENTEYTEERRGQLRIIINDMMDFREIARFALADKYEELKPDEQEEFTELFSKIIRDQSLKQLDIYRAEIIYDDIQVTNGEALVSTTAILKETRIPVNYRMKKKGDEWVFTDMAVDNAWTAESYRRSFQNILRRRGYEALIQNLRKRASQT